MSSDPPRSAGVNVCGEVGKKTKALPFFYAGSHRVDGAVKVAF